MTDSQSDSLGDVWLPLVRSRFTASAQPGEEPRVHVSKLDAEFEVLERAVVEARRLRNSYSAACRVPAEVLSLVFKIVKMLWDPYRDVSRAPSVYHSGWIAITHVCSVWREVALDTPSLWARHQNCLDLPTQYIPDFLFRSRMVPLDIELDWETAHVDGNANEKVLPIWLSAPIVYRIRKLTLSLFEPEDFDVACTLLPSGLTNLREVHIWASNSDRPGRRLPSTLGDLPHITHLTLVDCFVPWDAPIFSNSLTSLRLMSIPTYSIPFYRVARDLLSRMPSLQIAELDLIGAPSLEEMDSLPPRDREIVFPESLRELDLSIEPHSEADGIAFLMAIRIPTACARDIAVHKKGRPLPAEYLSSLVPSLLPRHFQAVHSENKKSLILSTTDIRSGPPDLTSHGLAWRHNLSHSSKTLAISTSGSHSTLHLPTANFCEHLEHLQLEELHALSLTSCAVEHFHKTGSWSQLLSASNVRELSVQDHLCPEMLNVLAELQPSRTAVQPLNLFPRLEVLRLYLSGENESAYMDMIIALVELITRRQEGGRPIRELIVPKRLSGWNIWGTVKSSVSVKWEL